RENCEVALGVWPQREKKMNRREFLESLAVCVVAAKHQPAGPPRPRKALHISMLPRELPYAQRFAMAHDAGFNAIEMQTIVRAEEAAEIREEARKAKVRMSSVMITYHL